MKKPIQPLYETWNIEVYVHQNDLEEIENIAAIHEAFAEHGITDPAQMRFEYSEAWNDYYGAPEPAEHRFYYRKEGYEEAEAKYEQDLAKWDKWKNENKDAIATEKKLKREVKATKKIRKRHYNST